MDTGRWSLLLEQAFFKWTGLKPAPVLNLNINLRFGMKEGFTAKRIVRSYRQAINAPAEEVFPLICPVREAEWLDGWDYRMVYSESGIAEEGCVFTSHHPGEESDTIWIITQHDPADKTV